MTAAARSLSGEASGRLGWVLPGSLALHVVVVAALPNAERAPITAAPVVMEMMDPPAPEPPPAPPERAPAPASEPRFAVAPLPSPRTSTSRAATANAANDRRAEDSPVDFTSAVMSNDGSGVPIGSGGGARAPVAQTGVGAAPAARSTGVVEPRVALARDLSRPPRAPGLDGALEQHYPVEARRSGISGKAVLRVMILPSGRVGTVRAIEESRSGFAEACEKAVRSARWEAPIDREGAAVATEITYTCRFEIRG